MFKIWESLVYILIINVRPRRTIDMLKWALIFLVIAIIAGILGFGGIAGAASGIAKILFFVFIVVFVLALLFGRSILG